MNKLIVTNEDMKIIDVLEKEINAMPKLNIIFNELEIFLIDFNALFKFTKGEEVHSVTLMQNGIKIGYSTYTLVPGGGIDTRNFAYPMNKKLLKKAGFVNRDHQLEKVLHAAETTHYILSYLEYVSLNREIEYVFKKSNQKDCLTSGANNNAISYNEIKLHDIVCGAYASSIIARKYTQESWGVRGHYRTLKNGKQIFVKPYIKGKKDGKLKNKVYGL